MIPAIIFAALAWIYILHLTDRSKLPFFKFLIGSVGFFILMMITLQPIITLPLAKAVAAAAGLIGNITGSFYSYYQYSLIFIRHGSESISLYVDYECSGVIEIFAFLSLLWFFPLYSWIEKTVISLIGVLYIFVANIIRLTVICLAIYWAGNDIFFFAHAILGRIVFYVLSIILFFYVFTRAQIIKQKVGNFTYGQHASDHI
ncbi:MAG: exosortase family protein XrtG [Clostridiaceae bacterium]|nr:exosortase family protein XrtG [Clostridiaceae bacterium]